MSYHKRCNKLYLTSKLGEGSSILPANHSAEMQTVTDYVDFFVDRLFLFCNFYCLPVPSVSFKHIKFILCSVHFDQQRRHNTRLSPMQFNQEP